MEEKDFVFNKYLFDNNDSLWNVAVGSEIFYPKAQLEKIFNHCWEHQQKKIDQLTEALKREWKRRPR